MVATRGGRPARAHGVRLTRRGRAAVVAVAVVALTGLWLGARAAASERAGAREAYRTVTVHPGDTLWEIATRYTPDADPRVTVHRIIDLNGLPGPAIQVGQRLALPTP